MPSVFSKHAIPVALAASMAVWPNAAQAQTSLTGHVPDETICSDEEGFPASALTDGDLETLWRTQNEVAPCHFVFRFAEPVAVAAVSVHNRYGKGAGTPSRRATIWASHQDFGHAYFRVAHEALNDEGLTVIRFDEPIVMRTLKLAVENPTPFSGDAITASLAELEIETVPAETASRWPMPRPEPLADGDPITPENATRCDDLAAEIFNPDSYGYGLAARDMDVSLALSACRAAVAEAPESRRLAFQLARVEGLAEEAVQSVARLASPLLADYPPAMVALANAFEHGRGVAANQERADALREAAAETGYAPAMMAVARAAEEAYNDAIVSGEATAEVEGQVLHPMLAQLLEIGHIPAYDLNNAYVLRTDTSALLGFMPRLEELAEFDLSGAFAQHLYNQQHGIPADRDRALRWIRANVARDDDPDSLGNLSVGASFHEGDNVTATRAARRGSYSGDTWPVEQYANRLGGSDAQRLYIFAYNDALRGAEAGDPENMFHVAEALIEGRGVEENREEGARWMRLAAATGEPRSINYLEENPWAREQ